MIHSAFSTITIEEIEQAFKNVINEKIISCKDVSKGVEQQVTIIETVSEKYIFKLPKKKEMNFREVMACNLLKNKIPVPEIIAYTDDFVIEKYIPGNDLNEIKLDKINAEKVYNEVGNILAVIHSHPTNGYGIIMPNETGKHTDLKSFSLYNEINLKRLQNAYLSSGEIKKVIAFIENKQFYFDNKQSVLLHYDFVDTNLRINNKKISGVIDFGDLSAGCPALDFAWIFIYHYGTPNFDWIVKGYENRIDIDEIKFFVVCNLIWFITYEDKRNKLAVQKKLNMLNDIVNYKSSFSFLKW